MKSSYNMNNLLKLIKQEETMESVVKRLSLSLFESALAPIQDCLEAPCAQSFLALEETLAQVAMQTSSLLVALVIVVLHQKQAWTEQVIEEHRNSEGSPQYRRQGLRPTRIRLLDGRCLSLKTPYLTVERKGKRGRPRGVGRRGPAGTGAYPVLETLGIQHQATPALLSLVARTSARVASFDEAQKVLQEGGCVLDNKTVRRLTLSVGSAALEQRTARLEAAQRGEQYSDEFAGKRIVLGTDGGRLRLREGGKRGRRRKSGRRGFHTPWREPKMIVAYVVDEEGQPIGEGVPLYDGTMGDANKAFEILVAELKLRGAKEALELLVVSDGARWIWKRTKELANELNLLEAQVVRIIDFYHVTQYLQEIADACSGWTPSEQKSWFKKMRRLLWKGRIDEVLEAVRQLKRGRRSSKITDALKYLENYAPFMEYNKYRKRGYPCGSGATESAMRRVVNLRLKGPGIFWKRENAEIMLHLRSYLKAGRWNELLERVLYRTPYGNPQNLLRDNHEVHPMKTVA